MKIASVARRVKIASVARRERVMTGQEGASAGKGRI